MNEEYTMKYCTNCGTQLVNTASFCSNCGQVLGGVNTPARQSANVFPTMRVVQDAFAVREQNLNEIGRLLQYFGAKQNLYDEYESLQAQVEKLAPPQDPNMGWLGRWLKFYSKNLLPFYLVGLLMLGALTAFSAGGSGASAGLIWLVIGAVILVRMIKKRQNRKETIDQCYQRINAIAVELNDYYHAFGPCIVGYEFSNPRILYSIGQMIQSGRADTIKEAINRMLEDNHRNYMEVQSQIAVRAARQAQLSTDFAAIAVLCSPNTFGR